MPLDGIDQPAMSPQSERQVVRVAVEKAKWRTGNASAPARVSAGRRAAGGRGPSNLVLVRGGQRHAKAEQGVVERPTAGTSARSPV